MKETYSGPVGADPLVPKTGDVREHFAFLVSEAILRREVARVPGDHEVVRDVVRAVATDDLDLLYYTFERLHQDLLWPDAMRALHRAGARASPRMQREFLEIYAVHGVGIRRRLLSDAEAVGALRLLLPPYKGPSMQLYRGDAAWNHLSRKYGLSWTLDRDFAEGHARHTWQLHPGGAVLLQAHVPKAGIISAPCLLEEAPASAKAAGQYIVDRRRLRNVRVIQRFSSADWEPPF